MYRLAKAFFAQRLGRRDCLALKVVRPQAVPALLHTHGTHDQLHGLVPASIERLYIARCLPVAVREPYRVAQRIELILAFKDAHTHFRVIAHRRGRAQVGGKGVGIRIDQQASGLTANNTLQKRAEPVLFRRQRQVGPYLCRRVAKPHRRDITCDHGRVRFARKGSRYHGGVQRVRKAVLEERGQQGVGDLRFGLRDVLLDHGGCKPPVCRGRTDASADRCFCRLCPTPCGHCCRNDRGASCLLQQLSARRFQLRSPPCVSGIMARPTSVSNALKAR